MDLEKFGWQIGISDILGWRECPTRMADGMRRHVGDEAPEATNWTNVYGSSVHHAIALIEAKAMSHDAAIKATMQEYASYLTPEDAGTLREDLNLYETRRPLGVVPVAIEQDMRVPLFVYNGPKVDKPTQVWFRFKLDVLHKMIANHAVFLHRDYKSSKWPKSPKEVHKDIQMWAYNWAIHERWPECELLVQTYDQLRAGEIETTKNDQQRADMKLWLIDQVTAIIEDDKAKPKINDFCRYCSMVITCPEPRRAAKAWRAKMAMLAPMTKEGRAIKIAWAAEEDELEEIIEKELPVMMRTRKHIEHAEKALKGVIEEMSPEERARLHWRVQERKSRTISPDGLRELHGLMGDTFYQLITLPITKLEEMVGKPKKGEVVPPELALAREWTVTEVSASNVVHLGD